MDASVGECTITPASTRDALVPLCPYGLAYFAVDLNVSRPVDGLLQVEAHVISTLQMQDKAAIMGLGPLDVLEQNPAPIPPTKGPPRQFKPVRVQAETRPEQPAVLQRKGGAAERHVENSKDHGRDERGMRAGQTRCGHQSTNP